MLATVRAISKGYIRFDVNGRRYWSYEGAEEEARWLSSMRLSVTFRGWRPVGGWRTLLAKRYPGPIAYDLTADRWLEDA